VRRHLVRLRRVADADADSLRRHPRQQALDDRSAELARGSGDDDHVRSDGCVSNDIVSGVSMVAGASGGNKRLLSTEAESWYSFTMSEIMPEPTASAGDAPAEAPADDARARLVAAAARLIAAGGREAATTRAVAAAAGLQPPTLYRLFGDMRGLLDAAARETLAGYVRQKAARVPSGDPIEDLRRGWDLHVAFGLAHPAVYTLIYGGPADGALSAAAREGEAHLHALVARVAAAGRLRVGVPHAARLIAAGGNGVTLALLATPPEARDPRLSDAMREAVLDAVITAGSPDAAPRVERAAERVAARAVALRAMLAEAPDAARQALSPAERQLLGEWLDRLAGADA
jgi:AcrR family transcriptional regulator